MADVVEKVVDPLSPDYWKGYKDGGTAERDIQKKMMQRYAAVFFVSFLVVVACLLLAIKFNVV